MALAMLAIKARYDGKKVVLPDEMSTTIPPGEVIVVFGAAKVAEDEITDWEKAQEASFAKAWDNDEDAVYDALWVPGRLSLCLCSSFRRKPESRIQARKGA